MSSAGRAVHHYSVGVAGCAWATGLSARASAAGSASVASLPFSTKRSDSELTQKRSPVGRGPSSKTWPRWPSQRLQRTSVRREKKLRSSFSATASGAIGCQKLGQPVPESNLASEEKSGWSQQTQV